MLHHFNHACNNLYRQSAAGKVHPWVATLLDYGKPPELIAIARHDKTKGHVSAIISPNLILTEEGFALSGLDSIPSGVVLTAWLNETYSTLGYPVLGGANGIRDGFTSIIKGGRVLFSEKAAADRPEMEWFIGKENVASVESYIPDDRGAFRYFDSFDYLNLSQFHQDWQPGMPLTPPLKPYLEEKLWLALFWSRPLQEFWRREIGENGQRLLQKVLPPAWILDPTPLPPHAVIPELEIQHWSELEKFSQERRKDLVIKKSRFSLPNGNSSADVLGSKSSASDWAEQVKQGLAEFQESPRVLLRLALGSVVEQEVSEGAGAVQTLRGHSQISPYYFVVQDRVTLGGVRATLIPDGTGNTITGPVISRA